MPTSHAGGMRATDSNYGDTDSLASVPYSRKLDERPPVVRWRNAVLSPAGPSAAPTKLVLLALANWMSPGGGSCWPSTTTISEATALSRRVVGLHLSLAVDEGWITRERRGTGRWNRGYSYQATFPPEAGP